MPGRKYSAGSEYRYGFNGQEKSKEIGQGLTTAVYWEYDSRIGKRWNIDPVYKHSPYSCFANNPIWYADPMGLDTVKNWQDAKAGDSWGNSSGGSTFYYKYNGKNWESQGVEKNSPLEAVVVTATMTPTAVREKFALAFLAMVAEKQVVVGMTSLLEGTGVSLANAELSTFRFLGPAAAVASTIYFTGDNVTPQQRRASVTQNINQSFQDGDPLAAKDYINNWNNDDDNRNNKIVMRYMSFGEFNARISPSDGIAVIPPFNSEGILSAKYITPDFYMSKASAKTKLSLPRAPDIAVWAFEIEIMGTKSPSGPGVYSTVKPKYGEPGGGNEAVIVQPFPIMGFFPLIK